MALWLVSPPQFGVFQQWNSLHGTRPAGVEWGSAFSKGKEGLCSQAQGTF